MSTRCYFHYNFHPVGQGLFSGGLLEFSLPRPRNHFRWVYDCGSQNRGPLHREILRWRGWPAGTSSASLPASVLDLMILSHFDNDHVNGLSRLLSGRKVDWLVLPYLTPGQRLLVGAIISRDDPDPDFLRFLVNPVGYLAALDIRIERIAFILPGGEPPETISPGPGPEVPSEGPFGSFGQLRPADEERFSDDPSMYSPHTGGGSGANRPYPKVYGISDSQPLQIGPLWEFCFLNPNRPELAHNLWDLVRNDYTDFFTQDEAERDYGMFIRKLKQAYSRVFGSSGPKRNDISLVTYTGPVTNHPRAKILWSPWPNEGQSVYYPSTYSVDKSGVLYCGDINMNAEARAKTKTHLGSARWAQIEILQVPHHGSTHSWEPNCQEAWPQRWSVFSSGRVSPFGHPDEDVVNDLLDNSPILVNELQGAHWGGNIELG